MTGFLAGVVFTLLMEGVFLTAVWLDRRDNRLEQALTEPGPGLASGSVSVYDWAAGNA